MESRRYKYELLRAQLESERSTFIPAWRDQGDYVLPRRPRFFVSDANKGDRRNQKIIDSTATLAARTLRSGMMSGVTSPARPWFRLTTPDPKLAELGSVKEWLHTVSQRMTTAFLRSNLYNCLPIIYGDLGVFGTACLFIEEDSDDVIRAYPFPIGSFMIANNDKLKVDVFVREFRMTVRQLIARFGNKDANGNADWSNFSTHVRNAWEKNQRETWVDVIHIIMPNEDYDPDILESKHKKYISCYYEKGSQSSGQMATASDDVFLSEKGYDYFPVLAPRWEVTGEDVYGTDCPGSTAIGDIKALQTMHKRKAQAVEKMVNPPMIAPLALKSQKASIIPGDITYEDTRDGQKGFRPAHEVNFRINELVMDIQEHQQRIKRAFFEDLFLMLASSDRRDITAREIDERHEEKLLALGPVLEQLNQDLLDPLIDICFQIMFNQGLIPPPPEELQGVNLKVEYISVMAQAQKLVGISGIERFAGFMGQMAQFKPEVLDKLNADQAADVYGDMTSVPPSIIYSDEEVAAMRAQRAKAQQAQAQAEQIQAGAAAAKNLSQADMESDNALTRILQGAGG